MRLIDLTVSNFKGIEAFTFDPAGEDVTVYGDNATGKSTLMDAFCWLLWDKDAQGRQEFGIKTVDKDGQPLHGLGHTVSATLELDNGRRLTLGKTYRETWSKRRGSATKTLTGHATDCSVDGVPVKRAEYQARIADLADEAVFQLLSDPAHFSRLHWQKRRRILLELCGDVGDAEVIASDPTLEELPSLLGERTPEQHRRVLATRRKEVGAELERVPTRIDEVQRSLPEAPDVSEDREGLKAQMETLHARREEQQAAWAIALQGGQDPAVAQRIREIDLEIAAWRRRVEEEYASQIHSQRETVRALEDEQLKALREDKELEETLARWNRDLQEKETELERLRQEWYATRNAQWEGTETCAVCGQALPPEQVEEAWARFNQQKAQLLEEIQSRGKYMAGSREELRGRIQAQQEALESARQRRTTLDQKVEKAHADLEQLTQAAPGHELPEQLAEERARLEAQREAPASEEAERLAAQIQGTGAEIARVESALSSLAQRERGFARIEELKADERRLAGEYEDLERQLWLVERFTAAQAELLEERINARFRTVRFRLFDRLVNGGIEPTCTALVDGVPFWHANTAAQVNAGLEIIGVLSAHYGVRVPVWVDRRESVVRTSPVDSQVIGLVVSEADPDLRVERARDKERLEVS